MKTPSRIEIHTLTNGKIIIGERMQSTTNHLVWLQNPLEMFSEHDDHLEIIEKIKMLPYFPGGGTCETQISINPDVIESSALAPMPYQRMYDYWIALCFEASHVDLDKVEDTDDVDWDKEDEDWDVTDWDLKEAEIKGSDDSDLDDDPDWNPNWNRLS